MNSKFGLRKKDCENHWKPCNIAEFKVEKPLIICLSGSGTITESEANGFCKLAEDLLEDESQKVDLMGVAYQHDDNDFEIGSLKLEEIDTLVNNVLMPLCKNQQTGQMLSTEDCCKNLSLITFFTFCHGNEEVCNILKSFNEKLQNEGLSKTEITALTQSLLEINYAKEIENVACPRISFESGQDSGGELFWYWYLGDCDNEELFKNKYAMVCDYPGKFCHKDFARPHSRPFGCITFVANSILKEENSFFPQIVSEEHNIGYLKRTPNGLHPKLTEEGKVLRQAMGISLQQRVQNSLENQNNNCYSRFYLQHLYSILEKDLPKHNRVENPSQQILSDI